MLEKKKRAQRLLEIFPAFLSWTILICPLIFSFHYPLAVAIFLVVFTFFWFFRTIEYTFFLLFSFWKFKKREKMNFARLLSAWETGEEISIQEAEKKEKFLKSGKFLDPSLVRHIVIIATCGESYEVLFGSFSSLANSAFSNDRLIVCLATEERKHDEAMELLERLKKDFDGVFGEFFHFEHPDGIAGEVRGKGGNITYSGRKITQILKERGENLEHYLLTTLDSDNIVHPEYFNALTLAYVTEEERNKKSYQPLPLFFNNIWDVPMINRIVAISGGFWHMMESGRPDRLRNFSSHAQPLLALSQMDFWATNTIVEDGHQFWRSYFHFRGEYEVIPLFIPIYQDAVQNTNWKKTLFAQYKQIRRWAWGCTDIPYLLITWNKFFREMPFWHTLIQFFQLLESHLFWATGAIVVTLATPIPGYLNPSYGESIYASNISYLLSFFFQFAIVGIFLILMLSFITVPRPPKKIGYFQLVIQWALLPIMTIFFGSLPAIEAQTRLALGKYLEFNVTEKIRSKKDLTK
jgi:hypothetical protein